MKSRIIKRIVVFILLITLGVPFSVQFSADTVSAATTEKQYRYHRYVDDKGNVSLCPYYGNWRYDTKMKIEYTEWMSEPLTVDNGKYSTYTHVYQGTSCKRAGCVDKSCDTNRYVDEDGEYWFYQETRTVTIQAAKDELAEDLPEASDIPELLDTPDEADEVITDETDSVLNQIGVSLAEYAIDLIDAVVDTFTPEDTITLGKAVLSYKESIKAILNTVVIGEIEDESIANELWEILENTPFIEDISDDVLDYAGALFVEALEEQPNLWEPIIKTTITKAPQIVLYIVSTGAGGKLLPLKLVLNVFEASAERFWEFGEAVADLWGFGVETADAIISDCEGLLRQHYENIGMVAEAAVRDRASETDSFLDDVQRLETSIVNYKESLINSIDTTLTPWFKLFHRNRTRALKEVQEELEALEIDYEEYYWDIVNET